MIIRYEDEEWVNGTGIYFWILRDINDTLISLITMKENVLETIEQLFFKLSVDLNRLIPLTSKKNTQELQLSYSDGILLLKDSFSFLKNDYDKLFNDNKETLRNIHEIRNKYDHVPHYIEWNSYIGNNKNKKMVFVNKKYNVVKLSKISDEEKSKIDNGMIKLKWEIETNKLVKILIMMNDIFYKIQKIYLDYFKTVKSALDYPYIKSILTIDFEEYNKVLNSF